MAREGLLPLIGAEYRRIDRKKSFVCLTGAKRRELRNFPVDPRNAGDPPKAGAITGKSPFGFFWDDCQKKLARQAQRERNAFDFDFSAVRRNK